MKETIDIRKQYRNTRPSLMGRKNCRLILTRRQFNRINDFYASIGVNIWKECLERDVELILKEIGEE